MEHWDYKVRSNNNTEYMIPLDYMLSKFVVLFSFFLYSVEFSLYSHLTRFMISFTTFFLFFFFRFFFENVKFE